MGLSTLNNSLVSVLLLGSQSPLDVAVLRLDAQYLVARLVPEYEQVFQGRNDVRHGIGLRLIMR